MIWAFITTTILGIITVLVLIAAVFGVTAINGAIQSVIDNNPGRIMPYNATGVITEIIGFLWLILALVLGEYESMNAYFKHCAMYNFCFQLFSVLNWHYTAVMWSLYNQMKGEMVELPSFAQPPFIQPSCGQPSFVQPSFTPPCSIQPSAPLGFECVQVVNQPPTKWAISSS